MFMVLNLLNLFHVLYKTESNKKEIVSVADNIELFNSINLLLNKITTHYHFKRSGINLFHNGTVTFNRIHLLKTSRLYTCDGYFDKNLQNIELQPLYQNILSMLNNGYVLILKQDCEEYVKKYLKYERVLYMPLFLEENIVGFVSFEDDNLEKVYTDKDIENLKKEVLNLELKINIR
jgi:hypothetical protein